MSAKAKRVKAPKRRSITERWILGSLLVTVFVVAAACVGIVLAMRQNYYQASKQLLEYRARLAVNYITDDDITSPSERYHTAIDTVESFDAKEHFELMLVYSDGSVLATSSGFDYDHSISSEDFLTAKISGSMSSAIGVSMFGEHYMAVTLPIGKSAGNIFAVRVVSSLVGIDNHIQNITRWAILFSLIVIGVSMLTGLYFVRSIVRPIQRLGESAKLIARGNYSVRIYNPIDDEIGELCGIINEMAVGLSATERAKNDFISSVSHELRTPLTSIRGWTETLLVSDPIERADTYKKGLSIISDETIRLYDMVEDLLDFSKIESGRMTFAFEMIDIVAELEDAALVVEPRATKLGINVRFDEPEYPIPLYADPMRLKQVFVNLLDNAVKYSAAGGTIEIEIDDKESDIVISVVDHGAGIPKSEIPNITQKFYKASNSVNGSGIGLAVVSEIVEAHGGMLNITSELGTGTTVSVRLPKKINNKKA